MMKVEMVAKPFIQSLGKYAEAKRIAVTAALNRGALRIRNAAIVSMRKTPRQVFGPHIAPPADALDDSSEPKFKKKPKGKSTLRGRSKLRKRMHASMVSHAPSVPGFPPAINTGRLVASGRVDFAKHKTATQVARVAFTANYAVPLEYGPRKNRRRRRPFLRPAFNKEIPRVRKEVREAFDGRGGY